MRDDERLNPYLLGALAIGTGVGLFVLLRSQKDDAHWSPAARLVAGAIGGGLLIYGRNATGKTAKLAEATGIGMLTRSLLDQPVRSLRDVIKPTQLMAL